MPQNLAIAVSLLSSPLNNLEKTLQHLNNSQADAFHLDIVDGKFAPQFGLGYPLIQAVQQLAQKPLEFHLMVEDPYPHLDKCLQFGAQSITVHWEGAPQLYRTLAAIKNRNCQVGLALSPHTPVHAVAEAIHYVDRILLLSVNPGKGGQPMLQRAHTRVTQLKTLAQTEKKPIYIEVDGGLTLHNAPQLCRAGATHLVAGAVVAKAQNPIACIRALKHAYHPKCAPKS